MYNYYEISVSSKKARKISRDESAATRWIQKNYPEENIILSVIHNENCKAEKFETALTDGIDFKGSHFEFLCAGAGDTRKSKMMFMRSDVKGEFLNWAMCGADLEVVNAKNCSSGLRFTNYLSLLFTNSKPEAIDLRKVIVVKDVVRTLKYTADKIDAVEGTCSPNEIIEEAEYNMNDGAGCFLPGTFNKHVATFRMPWFKGLLVEFDYLGVAPEVMTDVWGIEHNLKAEGINCILTDSQFKLYKAYNNWEEYIENFETLGHEFGWSVEPIEGSERECNYQVLQTLDMTWDEVEELASASLHDLYKYATDKDAVMEAICVKDNEEGMRYYGHSELVNSKPYIDAARDLIGSKINKIRTGKLMTHSSFMFVSPDWFAFFGRPSIKAGTVSCADIKDGEIVDLVRSPHMYAGGHCVRENVKVEGLLVPDVIYISALDNTSLLEECDWDGDKLLVFRQDCVITRVAARTEAPAIKYVCKSGAKHPVVYDFSEHGVYNELRVAHGKDSNVGLIANVATKICNNTDLTWDERNELLKFAAHKQQATIDYPKTGWRVVYAPELAKRMREQERRKLPKFMKIAKLTEDAKVYDGLTNTTTKRKAKDLKELQDRKYEAEWNPESTMGKINIILDMMLGNLADANGYKSIEDFVANMYYAGVGNVGAKRVCTERTYEEIGEYSKASAAYKLPGNEKLTIYSCWKHELTEAQQAWVDGCEFTFDQLLDSSFNRRRSPGFTLLIAKYEAEFIEWLDSDEPIALPEDYNTRDAGRKYGHAAAAEINAKNSKAVKTITEDGEATEYNSIHEMSEVTGVKRDAIRKYINDGKFHKAKNLGIKIKFEN